MTKQTSVPNIFIKGQHVGGYMDLMKKLDLDPEGKKRDGKENDSNLEEIEEPIIKDIKDETKVTETKDGKYPK